jgi:hypothetical protein
MYAILKMSLSSQGKYRPLWIRRIKLAMAEGFGIVRKK